MELEDLKKAWSEYDKKLTENLKTNNEIIRKMNLNNAKSSMDTPKKIGTLDVIFGFAFTLVVINYTVKFSTDYKILISGILMSIWLIILLVFSIRLLNAATKIDFNNDSIIKIQKQLIEYKKRYFIVKRYMSYTGFIFVIISVPITFKVVNGADVFKFPVLYAIAVASAFIVGHPVVTWISKNWYEKKIIETDRFLEELNRFETE